MRVKDGKIWDPVRGRWLVLTPEEWVRQHIVSRLTDEMGVEPHRIGREVLLAGGKRADLVVYDRAAKPVLVIECKAQSVAITRDVFEQVAGYNISLGVVRYLAVTNGREFYCWEFDLEKASYILLENLPENL